jgi:ubiquinone biosynthesis UbiH/UbiF/VisC/COQ6 family hydroxylase
MNRQVFRVDVTIVGAGLVGLAAAIALHQAGFSVLIVDSKNPTKSNFSENSWDVRIYAISPRNAEWLSSLGVWPIINVARVGQIQGMEIFGAGTQSPLKLSANDANADTLGYIIESKALMQALLKQVDSLGIKTIFDKRCDSVISIANRTTLLLPEQVEIESKLLIAADGSHSWVRQKLNMHMQHKSYEQTAIVANFKAERPHNNIARQWFTLDAEGRNCILAWLPLPQNMVSIVWSVSTNQADILLKLSEDEFTKSVIDVGGSHLGEFKLIGSAAKFPLSLQKTNTLVHGNVVLVGDAAHQVHPLAGQGVNLGFRDVIDFIEILKHKHQYQAINDSRLLKQYSRVRKADIFKMVLLTDGLYQLYESQNKVIGHVRNWGLSKTNHQTIKKMLVANAIAL